jgi:hypothetical protein
MGYSCSAKASFVREAIEDIIKFLPDTPKNSPSNFIRISGAEGFWEIGGERPDGSITGKVFKTNAEGFCQRIGSFKITAEGRIERFPGLAAAVRHAAEARGANRYVETFGAPAKQGSTINGRSGAGYPAAGGAR